MAGIDCIPSGNRPVKSIKTAIIVPSAVALFAAASAPRIASLSKRSSRRSITTNTSICGRSFASQCRVVTERYYGELANTVHDVRLARKNVTALLVGVAIDWSNCIAQTTRFPSTGLGPTAARRQYCHSGCPNDAIGGWPRSLRIHHHWLTVLRDLADQ